MNANIQASGRNSYQCSRTVPWARVILGETGGRVAETSVSTLLVLAAILTAFVPLAGPSNPAAAAQVTVVVSGRTLTFSTESFGSAAPVVSSEIGRASCRERV